MRRHVRRRLCIISQIKKKEFTYVYKMSVPIINIQDFRKGTPTDRQAFANNLADVCHSVGFFSLVGHELEELQLRVKLMLRKIFVLERSKKETIAKQHSKHFRGWEPLGTELTNGRVDLREQVDTWTDCKVVAEDMDRPYLRLYGPSQYFDDKILPGYEALTKEFMNRCGLVADELLSAMALGLGLHENHFRQTFGDISKRMSLCKFIHYPGSETEENKWGENQHGVNAHKDAAFLTLLLPDGPGLEIQLFDGRWVPVEVVEGAFVINLGEALQSLTGNYFVATPHRVVTSRERYSCGFFQGSDLEYNISNPLPLDPKFAAKVQASKFHREAKYMARKEETERGVGDIGSEATGKTYGEMIWNYFSRAYPEIVNKHYGGGQARM